MNILTKVFMCLKTQMQTAKFIQTTNCFTAKSDLQVDLNFAVCICYFAHFYSLSSVLQQISSKQLLCKS